MQRHCFITGMVCAALLSAWQGPSGQDPPSPDKDEVYRASKRFIVGELGEPDLSVGVAFSPDGTWLLAAGTEQDAQKRYLVTKWSVGRQKVLDRFPIDTNVCLDEPALSPSGRAFAVADQKGMVVVCDSHEGKVLFTYRHWEEGGSFPKLLTFLDEDHILSVDFHCVGQKRNIRNKQTWVYRIGGPFSLWGIAITPSRERLAYLTPTAISVMGKDLKKGIGSVDHKLKDPKHLAITDDGAYALASDNSTELSLYDLKEKKQLGRWAGHASGEGDGWGNEIVCIVAVRNEHIFVTSDRMGYVRFWDVRGEKLAEVRCRTGIATSLAVSPDNRLLATSGRRQPIVLWDLARILRRKQ